MCLSSWATTSLEDVASSAPDGLRWLQLYVYNDRETTKSLILRAEAAGYQAIALTVDTPILGRRVLATNMNLPVLLLSLYPQGVLVMVSRKLMSGTALLSRHIWKWRTLKVSP